MRRSYARNPLTGRKIKKNGPVFERLSKAGYFQAELEPGAKRNDLAAALYHNPDLFPLILAEALIDPKTALSLLLTSKRTKSVVEKLLTDRKKIELLHDRYVAPGKTAEKRLLGMRNLIARFSRHRELKLFRELVEFGFDESGNA